MRLWLRKMLLSLTASVGILAIANMDTIYQETRHPSGVETPYFAQVLKARPAKAEIKSAPERTLDQLKDSFTKDELNDQTPLANLAAFAPLEQIFSRGVIRFERQTLRSSTYQSESGYDRIVYKLEDPHGEISYVVNSIEKDQIATLIVQNGKATSYLGSEWIDESDVRAEQIPLKLSERLGSSVPFLSVAR